MSRQQPAGDIPPLKKTIFFSLTAALTLLAVLVLGEICARLFFKGHPLPTPPPAQEINPYRANPYIATMRPYLYFHIPGARYFQKIGSARNEYRINAMGFRGPEISPLPPPKTKRLLVLGDSIVEGHGVRYAETFSRHLGQRLVDENWEVVNLGAQGASPLYFAANLERYLYLRPDAVLILLHENDLFDDELREKSYFTLPLLDDRAGLFSGGRSHSPGTKSRLYGLLENSWKNVSRTPLERIIADNASQAGIHAGRKVNRGVLSFAVPQEKFGERWKMSSAYLNHLLAAMRDKNIQVLASTLCTVTLSFPAVPSYASHCTSLDEHGQLWAQKNDVPFLSLVPTMQQAFADHKIAEVLLINDFHPTPLTHGLLADALYPFVLSNLPAPAPIPAGHLD
ncbi:MAG: SGNH/GDSL hydrolase family protein [Desulfobulbaceae bacterium]